MAGVVALDCEMVGVAGNARGMVEDALCRVSVVKLCGQDAYQTVLDTWVHIERDIVDYRSAITGLGAKSFRKKSNVSFDQARAMVASLIAGKIVVGHALWNDFKVLKLEHPKWLVRDTALYEKLRPPWRAHLLPSLNLLARCWLGSTCQAGVHDSVTDATTALQLYDLHAVGWEMTSWSSGFQLPACTPSPWSAPAGQLKTVAVRVSEQAFNMAKSGGWPLANRDTGQQGHLVPQADSSVAAQ